MKKAPYRKAQRSLLKKETKGLRSMGAQLSVSSKKASSQKPTEDAIKIKIIRLSKLKRKRGAYLLDMKVTNASVRGIHTKNLLISLNQEGQKVRKISHAFSRDWIPSGKNGLYRLAFLLPRKRSFK